MLLVMSGCGGSKETTAVKGGTPVRIVSSEGGSGTAQVVVMEDDTEVDEDLLDPLRAAATAVPEEIEQFDVDGLTVILRPTGSSFHTIVAKLFIRGGFPAIPSNVSPAMEQLALDVPRFSGPASMTREQFERERDRLYLGYGATAERDFSTLTLRCVDENFERAWELFSGSIVNPGFDPVAMTNIKERGVTAVRNRQVSPEAYADYLADSIFFYNHPYGRVPQEEDYAPITTAQLKAYHDQLFVKSRMFIVVVGNITRQEITEKIRSSLGKLPMGSYKAPTIPIPQNANRPTLFVARPWGRETIPTNYLVVRHLGPRHDDSLFYAMQRLRGYVGGFLFRKIRIDRNLSYAPDASTYDHSLGFGDITISTVYPDSAYKVTNNEIIDFFRDNLIKQEYLDEVPATWYTSQYLGMQTAESQAEEIGRAWYYNGDWREAYRSLERNVEVTSEQLNEAATKYMKNFTIVIVGNPESVDPKAYAQKTSSNR